MIEEIKMVVGVIACSLIVFGFVWVMLVLFGRGREYPSNEDFFDCCHFELPCSNDKCVYCADGECSAYDGRYYDDCKEKGDV